MTGAVVELSGNRVKVRPTDCAACFGCLRADCAARGLVTVENREKLPLSPGQRVEIRSPFAALLGQTLASLLPLLLGFAAGYGLSGFFALPEPARAAAGIPGFLAAGGIVYALRRRFPAAALPRVRRILAD
jgi:hypothetical protein